MNVLVQIFISIASWRTAVLNNWVYNWNHSLVSNSSNSVFETIPSSTVDVQLFISTARTNNHGSLSMSAISKMILLWGLERILLLYFWWVHCPKLALPETTYFCFSRWLRVRNIGGISMIMAFMEELRIIYSFKFIIGRTDKQWTFSSVVET